ncbi:transposase [Clostridium sp. FP1]|uniref:IS4 family transposase n=1 Tax=Clostridium sp. FP1 TaxID=2724076 RepID=UPI0013E95F47|nr:transposase [Clostridium sp. FP1]MBZ9632935.1 transposase [Clostridium sp. FP1]MBZ9632938.1 transposase [Clostridium sp. FP1]MBZ9633732.1 transposase [Clostridium sp. FP1]MBZ9634026.1 transposase [Clostridium sp. FP1]MBZ9635124.1 transposase [Clostridium sp. FP1]
MNNIPQNSQNENDFMKSIMNFIKQFKVISALKKANCYKEKGICVRDIFCYLLQIVYTGKSMYMSYQTESNAPKFGKDVVYRFLNSMYINWQSFLLKLSGTIINESLVNLTSEKRINAIVVDDSFYGRLRSKNVELLSNVNDHASKGQKYKKGFRMLTLGWTDGNTFLPILFNLQSSEKQKNRYCEMKEGLNKNTIAYKRRKQAISKSTDVMIEMLEATVKAGIPAKHVLFDSWFSYPVTIIRIFKLKLHTVGRLKNTTKIKYIFEGERKTLAQIYKEKRKRPGKSKYLLSVMAQIYDANNNTLDVKIVFVRDRNNKKKWIAIISTDLSLSEEEIITLYGKRWSIEVFFKVCKSYLNLGKEFQGLSYDSMIAHTSIVMVRYMMLAVENRNNKDSRTMGEIFFLAFDELKDIQFSEVLEIIFNILQETLQELLFLTVAQIDSFIAAFIIKLPKYISRKFTAKKIA